MSIKHSSDADMSDEKQGIALLRHCRHVFFAPARTVTSVSRTRVDSD